MRLLEVYPKHLSWKVMNGKDRSLWEMQPYRNTQHHVELNREEKET